jgi:hypothetical protein
MVGKIILINRWQDHARDSLLSLCALKNTQEVAESLYNDDGSPMYWKEGKILHPQFLRPFSENFKVWGKQFYKVCLDPSRMRSEHTMFLKSVPQEKFKSSLSSGAFASMATVAKKKHEGGFDTWHDNRKSSMRHNYRKRDVSSGVAWLDWMLILTL